MYSGNLFQSYSNNIAVINDQNEQMSYYDLFVQCNELYYIINQRCLVFCLCKNAIGSLIGYTSFLSNKVVPLLLDASIDIGLLNNLISIYQPKYLWLPNENLSDFNNSHVVYSAYQYSLIQLNPNINIQFYDSLALLLTTSGSTGSPKLVRLSYKNIEANATSISEYLSINNKERPITTLPMNYSFGLSIINSHLLKGATILLNSHSLMEKEFWAFLKKENATSLSGVPYTYEMLKRLRFFRMDFPSLTTLTQAGGKLNTELNKEFAEYCQVTNKRFYVMYGQTEATARMSYLLPEVALDKLGSIGKAIPGGEFKLIDDFGQTIISCETVGELVYKGANVSLGYAETIEDLRKGDENNGMLITGDLAIRDSDNYYYIVGRKKRFIKLFGNRVNLDETERIIKGLVLDCACTGTDDKLVVYISEPGREVEVRHYLVSKTGINHSAIIVRQIDTIPKNSSGKTIYTNLEI